MEAKEAINDSSKLVAKALENLKGMPDIFHADCFVFAIKNLEQALEIMAKAM